MSDSFGRFANNGKAIPLITLAPTIIHMNTATVPSFFKPQAYYECCFEHFNYDEIY